jgi:N-carbamoylputrescine amidase
VKVTVCELPHEEWRIEPAWAALCAHTQSHHSDWVLLPEFAFVEPVWQRETFDHAHWATIVAQSEAWLRRLGELDCAVVVGARPILDGDRPYNEAFLWRASGSIVPLRRKAHLPDEPGGWEARWFHRGAAEFPVHREADVTFGVNICTEMWALQTYAAYADQGVHAVLSPRATGAATTAKWLALGTTAAVRSGAYSLLSNRIHHDGSCGGVGWVISPDGELMARTSPEQPACTVDIDLAAAAAAKASYPRYVFRGSADPVGSAELSRQR